MAVALCLLAWGCNRLELETGPSRRPTDPRVAARAVDAAVAEDLAAGSASDARYWLRGSGNRLFQGDPREVQRLVDDLYRDGARHVWFTGIEHFAGANVTASLAVELPRDAVKRSALLRRAARFRGSPEPPPDVGQRYLQFLLN